MIAVGWATMRAYGHGVLAGGFSITLSPSSNLAFACAQNHSCAPSMYSKILNVGGRQRLVFFARQDIEAGQELTYNYRQAAGNGGGC